MFLGVYVDFQRPRVYTRSFLTDFITLAVEADVKALSATRPEDLQAEQVSISQQQLVHLIRSLIFQQKVRRLVSQLPTLRCVEQECLDADVIQYYWS